LVVVAVERQGLRFSLSHIAKSERRATFMTHDMFAPGGRFQGRHGEADVRSGSPSRSD
jgi:hypothetical protein